MNSGLLTNHCNINRDLVHNTELTLFTNSNVSNFMNLEQDTFRRNSKTWSHACRSVHLYASEVVAYENPVLAGCSKNNMLANYQIQGIYYFAMTTWIACNNNMCISVKKKRSIFCVTFVNEYGLETRIGKLPLYAFWPKANGPII